MPYFDHAMARGVSEDPQRKSSVNLRTLPGGVSGGKNQVSEGADPALVEKYVHTLTQRKLLFMRSLLRAQLEQLEKAQGAKPTSDKEFEIFKINKDKLLHEDGQQKIYDAKNSQMPQFIMMCRVVPVSKLDPNGLYMRMLRHLGRKHPFLIHTWDIFTDNTNIYIFQEFVTKGNLIVYLEQNGGPVIENQCIFWARQIFKALDFLGDIGIAHRGISPNYLVIKAMGAETWIKLTGFRNSIIYWDVKANDVNFCPCWPAEQQKDDGANFQAPEVYGNPQTEFFDPIRADTWSFGANLYYMIAQQYPYNVLSPYKNIDEEIWHNISSVPNVSDHCQQFIYSTLRTNANNRIPFDFIGNDPWIKSKTPNQSKSFIRPKQRQDDGKGGSSSTVTKGKGASKSKSEAKKPKSAKGKSASKGSKSAMSMRGGPKSKAGKSASSTKGGPKPVSGKSVASKKGSKSAMSMKSKDGPRSGKGAPKSMSGKSGKSVSGKKEGGGKSATSVKSKNGPKSSKSMSSKKSLNEKSKGGKGKKGKGGGGGKSPSKRKLAKSPDKKSIDGKSKKGKLSKSPSKSKKPKGKSISGKSKAKGGKGSPGKKGGGKLSKSPSRSKKGKGKKSPQGKKSIGGKSKAKADKSPAKDKESPEQEPGMMAPSKGGQAKQGGQPKASAPKNKQGPGGGIGNKPNFPASKR